MCRALTASAIALAQSILCTPVAAVADVIHDVTYASPGSGDPTLDIYLPDGPILPTLPTIVAVHGGGFVGGDKAAIAAFCGALAAQGFVVVSANYTLATLDEPSYPQAVRDVRAVVRWVRTQGRAQYGLSGTIALMGSSAGATLASTAALTSDIPFFHPVGPPPLDGYRVEAFVSMWGPTDFVHAVAEPSGENAISIYLGEDLSKSTLPLYENASPVTHVDACDPSALFLHGTADQTVPFEQSLILADALVGNGVSAAVIPALDGSHGFESFGGQANTAAVIADALPSLLATSARSDVNCDGAVDGEDLAILLSFWGTKHAALDLDDNGIVAGGDLGILLSDWG